MRIYYLRGFADYDYEYLGFFSTFEKAVEGMRQSIKEGRGHSEFSIIEGEIDMLIPDDRVISKYRDYPKGLKERKFSSTGEEYRS